jgi:hypothetical protein
MKRRTRWHIDQQSGLAAQRTILTLVMTIKRSKRTDHRNRKPRPELRRMLGRHQSGSRWPKRPRERSPRRREESLVRAEILRRARRRTPRRNKGGGIGRREARTRYVGHRNILFPDERFPRLICQLLKFFCSTLDIFDEPDMTDSQIVAAIINELVKFGMDIHGELGHSYTALRVHAVRLAATLTEQISAIRTATRCWNV